MKTSQLALTVFILCFYFCGFSLASAFPAGFSVKINKYSLLWTAPKNPHIAQNRIMFPLLGLIHITRGFEQFKVRLARATEILSQREFVAPEDFDRFVRINDLERSVTIHLLNTIGDTRVIFKAGETRVTRSTIQKTDEKLITTPIQMLNNDPRLTFVALRDLANIFGFVVQWNSKTRTAQLLNLAWMGLANEELSSRLSPVEVLENFLLLQFNFTVINSNFSARIIMKNTKQDMDSLSAGVYIFAETYGTSSSFSALTMINPKFERPVAGRDPPNVPNPCRMSLLLLDCQYRVPIDPDRSVKYILGVTVRLL